MKNIVIIKGDIMLDSYDVNDDQFFQNYIKKQRVGEESVRKYKKVLNKFCKAVGKPFEDIINICKEEQRTRFEKIDDDNFISIEFDKNNPQNSISQYFDDFVIFCKDKNNKNSTINDCMDTLRSFLNFYGVKYPNWIPLEDDSDDWFLLEKEDFKFVLDDCNIVHKSLIVFMLSTGFRLGDALNLTVGDFMDATKEMGYHNFTDVEEFVDNAPDDMIGFWDFIPNKTKNLGLQCKTFNSAEASNLIMQNLRRIKNDYFPRKSKRIGQTLKMSKSDALFASQRQKYKGKIKSKSISDQFTIKNKKFHEWKVNKIKKDVEDGKISAEDMDKEIAKIPKFHAHGCRKYFISKISIVSGNLKMIALMEGHKMPLKTDESYASFEKDDLYNIYLEAIESLTLEKINPKLLTNKKVSELEHKLTDLEGILIEREEEIKKLKEKDGQFEELLKENESLKQQTLANTEQIEKAFAALSSFTSKKEHVIAPAIINHIPKVLGDEDKMKQVLILQMAVKYANENKAEFEYTEEYLNSLINKMQLKIALSNKSIQELFDDLGAEIIDVKPDGEYQESIKDILDIIKGNEEIKKILGDINYDDLEPIIAAHLKRFENDINNLSDNDKSEIIESVLMEYL